MYTYISSEISGPLAMMYFQDLVAFAGSLMIFIFICIWVTCLSNICADNFYLKKNKIISN